MYCSRIINAKVTSQHTIYCIAFSVYSQVPGGLVRGGRVRGMPQSREAVIILIIYTLSTLFYTLHHILYDTLHCFIHHVSTIHYTVMYKTKHPSAVFYPV